MIPQWLLNEHKNLHFDNEHDIYMSLKHDATANGYKHNFEFSYYVALTACFIS